MVWAGSAQEDPASGETSSPSDGTFWHITSVLKTGGWSVHRQRGQDRFVRDRATEPPRALRYRVPVVYGAAIFSAPLEDRECRVRVVDRGQRPLPELVEQSRLILPRVGDGDWVEGVEVIRAFLGHDQVGGGMAVGLATVTGRSTVAHLSAITIDRLRTTKINFIERKPRWKARPAAAGHGPDRCSQRPGP